VRDEGGGEGRGSLASHATPDTSTHTPCPLFIPSLQTAHHAVALCVKTALDAHAPAPGFPGSQPVASADCEASAMVSMDVDGGGGGHGDDDGASPPPLDGALVGRVRAFAAGAGDAVTMSALMTRFDSMTMGTLKR